MNPEPEDSAGPCWRGSSWLKKSSKPGGTLRRCWVPGRGRRASRSAWMDTTAGVTRSAIVAKPSPGVPAGSGDIVSVLTLPPPCANRPWVQSSEEAKNTPPMKAEAAMAAILEREKWKDMACTVTF